MFFRELNLPDDYRSTEAATLVFQEVYGDYSERTAAELIAALSMNHVLHYGCEVYSQLLAVGSLETRFLNDGIVSANNIAVTQRLRSGGVGRQLMSFLEQESREMGANLIRLTALPTAVGFYVKVGYQPIDSKNPLELGKLL